MTRLRAALAGVAILALAGCATLASLRGRAVASCPGPLVSTLEIEGEFLRRERVRIVVGEQAIAFQQVVQKRGDELLLLGLHPLGAKLFSVVQRGVDTEVEASPPPLLEVPPETLLADLHRVRFRKVPGAGPQGTFRTSSSGDEIVERWEAGRLHERVFRSIDGGDDPVRVHFSNGNAGDEPARVIVENPGCGYRAEIVALVVD